MKLEIAPRYFREFWAFLKNHHRHLEYIRNPDSGDPYAPWAAFITGIAIFLSILALDAANLALYFDRIAFFTVVLSSAFLFVATLHFVAWVLGGKARLAQTTAGAEYLIGFLLPGVTFLNYCVVTLLNLLPGISNCSLGAFNHAAIVFTSFNQVAVTLAIGVVVAGAIYATYRTFVMFKELEQLAAWKMIMAMVFAGVPVVWLHSLLEFYSVIFSSEIKKIASILSGSSD